MYIQAESGIEAILSGRFLDEANKEIEALMLVKEAPLALEVVSFEESRQAGEDRVLDRDVFFATELAHQIDGSTFAGELLHLAIVRLD